MGYSLSHSGKCQDGLDEYPILGNGKEWRSKMERYQYRLVRDMVDEQEHKKLYKAKKQWLVSGITSAVVAVGAVGVVHEMFGATPTQVVHAARTWDVTVLMGRMSKVYDGTTNFTPDTSKFNISCGDISNFVVPQLTAEDFDFSKVGSNVGTYTYTLSAAGIQKIKDANPTQSLNVPAGSGTLDVVQKQISIFANPAGKIQGEADPALTATVVGKPAAGVDPVYTVTRAPGEDYGTYLEQVKYNQSDNPNYKIATNFTGSSSQNVFFTITDSADKEITTPADEQLQATVGDIQKNYDGTADFSTLPTVTLTGGKTVTGLTTDDFDWSNVTASAGSYSVTLSAAGIAKVMAQNPGTNLISTSVAPGTATINQVAATITANDASKDVGATDPTLTATVTGTVNGDTLMYSLNRVAGEDAGTYAINITPWGKDGTQNTDNKNYNYDLTLVPGTFTIENAAPTVTPISATVGNLEKNYDGTTNFSQTPTVSLSNGGTVPALSAADFDYSQISANAGSYQILLNATGIEAILAANPNTTLAAADVTAGKVTINKENATITVEPNSKEAGAPDPDLTATVSGVVNNETLDYTVTRQSGETAGTYQITAVLGTGAVNNNYNITTVPATFTITVPAPTALQATVNNFSAQYNGTTSNLGLPTVTIAGNYTVPTLTAADFDWSAVQANAGSYTVTLSASGIQKILAANTNTTLPTGNITAATLTIEKAPLTITAVDASKTQGQTDPTLTATFQTPTNGATPVYTVSREAGETPGNYAITVTATAAANPNYTITTVPATFTINPPAVTALTAKVGNINKTYDGITSFTTVPTVTLSNDATVPTLTEADFDYSQVQAGVGTYAVTLNSTGISAILNANANTSLATSAVTAGQATITAAPATITANSASKVQGTSDPTLTANVTGAVNGETLEYTVTRATGEEPGTYDITVSAPTTGVNQNYDISTNGSTFTITAPAQTALTAYVGNVTKSYDATTTFNTLPTVTLSDGATVPTLDASDFDFTAVNKNVGSYAVTLSGSGIDKILAANANTTLTTANVTGGQATITQATATITAQSASKIAGADDPALIATVTGAKDSDSLAYTVSRAAGEAVGDYDITVSVSDAAVNQNYAITTVPATFTIEAPATITLQATVGNLTKTYDGSTTFGDLPTVSLSNDAVVPELNASDFDFDGVQANAGNYQVTLSAAGIAKILDANANTTLVDSDITAGSVTIAKQAATIQPNAATKVAGADDPTLSATVTGTVNDETLAYTLSREPGETPGAYTISVSAPSDGINQNYDITTGTAVLTITTPAATVLHATVGSVRKPYDGTATFTVVPTVTLDHGATVPDLTSADFDYSAVQAGAGQYSITLNATGISVILGANDNTTLSSDTITAGTATVNKVAATITAQPASKELGATDPTLTATVTGAVNGDVLDYTLSRAAGETVGQYAITVATASTGVNQNYTITTTGAEFTITAPASTVLTATVGNVTKTYDGTTAVDAVPTVTLDNDATVPTLTSDDFDYDNVAAGVGSYEVTLNSTGIAAILAANANTTLAASDVTAGNVVVTPKEATITPNDVSKYVGASDPALTATVAGNVAGETLNYTLTRAVGETTGTYDITVSVPATGVNANYAITTGTGTFTITDHPVTALTATVGDQTKTYDGTDTFDTLPTVTLSDGASLPSEWTADDFVYNADPIDAGSYTVTLSAAGINAILAANPYTNLTNDNITAGNVTVAQKRATITAQDAAKIVDTDDPTLTARVTGTVNDDTLAYTIGRDAGEAVGVYTITVTPATTGTNANYEITTVPGVFTITPQAIQTLHATVNGMTKTYDGLASFDSLPAVVVTGGATIPTLTADDFDFSGVGAGVGTYDVTLSSAGLAAITGANPNTSLVSADVTPGEFIVQKANATITANNATKVAGQTDPALTATVTGAVNGESLDYTVSRATGEAVQTYPITVTVGTGAVNDNYNITTAPGTFTITAIPIVALKATVGDITKAYDATSTFSTLPTVTLNNGATLPTLTATDFDFTAVQADAGQYTFTLSDAGIAAIIAANDHVSLAADDVTAGTATITKKAASITATDASKVEGSADPTLTATTAGTVADQTLAYTVARTTGETSGTYVISLTAPTTGVNKNYQITTNTGIFTITAHPVTALTATVGTISKTYDGTTSFADLPTVTLNDGFATPTLTAADFDYSAIQSDAGSYAITLNAQGIATILAGTPYATLGASDVTPGTATIAQAHATITATDATKVAEQPDPTLTATVTGAVNGETLTYTINRVAGEAVGSYVISIDAPTEGVNRNYTITTVNGTFTITAIPVVALTATVGNVTKTYDGTTVFADVPTVTLSDGASVPELTRADFDFSQVDSTAGDYTITLNEAGIAAITSANAHTSLDPAAITAGTATINKALATITANDETKEEYEVDPTLTATVVGAVNGETLDYTVSRARGEAVDTYAITVTPTDEAVNQNYTITTVPGTFTITAPVIVALQAKVGALTKTYDGTTTFANLPAVTLANGTTVTGLNAADFDFSQVSADAGTYNVTLTDQGIADILAANPHTSLAPSDVTAGTVTIRQAAATITAGSFAKTVGDPDPTLTATVTGAIAGQQLEYRLTRVAGETVGRYAITVQAPTDGVNKNYAITTVNGLLTIAAPDATTLTATVGNAAKTYDGTDEITSLPTVTLADGTVVTGLTADDFDLSQIDADAGEYAVTLNADGIAAILAANPNTIMTSADVTAGSVTVNKAAATITANDATKTVGDADPTLTATVSGTVGHEQLAYTVARAAGETAGTYEITVTPTANDVAANYTITTVPATFTITPPVVTALTATVRNLTKTYDGTATFATMPAVSLSNGAVTPVLTSADFDFSDVNDAAGSYHVTLNATGIAAILAANDNTSLAASAITAGTVTINQAQATITATDVSKTVGDPDPALTATVVGAVAGDQLSYTVARDEGETIGTYPINVTPANTGINANYAITVVPGTMTIVAKNQEAIAAKVGTITKTYDGTTTFTDLPAVTLSDGQAVNDLTASDFDFSQIQQDAGSYTITLTAAGIAKINAADSTHILTADQITAGQAVIAKATATIQAVNAGKVAGNADPQLTAIVSGAVNGESLGYTVSRTAGETAGTYVITVNVNADSSINKNYDIEAKNATFTISAKPNSGQNENGGGTKPNGNDGGNKPNNGNDTNSNGGQPQPGDDTTQPESNGTGALPATSAPVTESEETKSTTTAQSVRKETKMALPQTGEAVSPWAQIGLALTSLMAMLGLTKRRRDNEKNDSGDKN